MPNASLAVLFILATASQPSPEGNEVGVVALPEHVELTNTTVAERSRRAREEAIRAGDAEAVLREGGTPQEIVAALGRLAELKSDARVSQVVAAMAQLNPGEYYEPAKDGNGQDLLLKVGPDGKSLIMISMDLGTAETLHR